MRSLSLLMTAGLLLSLISCKNSESTKDTFPVEATYAYNRDRLAQSKDIVELKRGTASLTIVPDWQARVMTSSSSGDSGFSFGWINHDHISSGEIIDHMNPFGGEERIWLGPEGGQFSVFFKQDDPFEFEYWQTPAILDTEKFNTLEINENSASFARDGKLINYSGTEFDFSITRKISLLDRKQVENLCGCNTDMLDFVAYRSDNILENTGTKAWKKESGLLSVWMLGMFNPSPSAIVAVPVKPGNDDELGPQVNDNYFGSIPEDRLMIANGNVYFRADGKMRGKIGIPPLRSKGLMASYDADNNAFTLLYCKKPEGVTDYVNSAWELQDYPYSGDALNSYNDGPLDDGSIMGPFYELESSSPALSLDPGASYNHSQTTIHFTGPDEYLDAISINILGISLEELQKVFQQ